MSALVSRLSSSVISLKTLQNDATIRTRGAEGGVNSTIRSPDPRSAYAVSPPIANVLLSFSDKASARTTINPPIDNQPNSNSSAPFVIKNVNSSDAPLLQMTLHRIAKNPGVDIKEFTSHLPSYLAKQIEARSPSDLANTPKIRLDDESFAREARNSVLGIYEIATTDEKARQWVALHMSHSGPYDPDDATAQAVLNGTAKIVRGPDLAEAGYVSYSKKLYGRDPVTGVIEEEGVTTWAKIDNKSFIANFENKNPGLTVHPVYLYDEVALVIYPVASNVKRTPSPAVK